MRCGVYLRAAIILAAIPVGADGLLGADKSGKRKADTNTSSTPDLDGVWRGFVVEGKGENPNGGPTALELMIKGNRISARKSPQGEALGEGMFKLTTVGGMSAMDAMEVRKAGRPKGYLGICDLSTDDTIKWCVATPGVRRPMNFETRGQQFLLILKRQKP